jgi:hypothetical protein
MRIARLLVRGQCSRFVWLPLVFAASACAGSSVAPGPAPEPARTTIVSAAVAATSDIGTSINGVLGPVALQSEFAALCEQPAQAMDMVDGVSNCCPVQNTLMCEPEGPQHGPFIELRVVFIERHGQRRLELIAGVSANPGMVPTAAPIVVLNDLAVVADDEGFVLRASNPRLDEPAYCMDPGPAGVRFCSGAGAVAAAAGRYVWRDGFPVRASSP